MNLSELEISDEEILNSYQKYMGRKAIFIVSSILVLVLAAGLAGSMGQAKITIWDGYAAFFAKFFQRFSPELKRTFYCRKSAKKRATRSCGAFYLHRKICSN